LLHQKPEWKPTAEQLAALDLFRTGSALKVNAFAGTGKTTTLQLIAGSTPKRGLYLAFNRSIANEAKQAFSQSVTCSTVHGLAFRSTPSAFRDSDDKMTKSLNANAFAFHLGYHDEFFDGVKLSARQQGHLAKETLRRFQQSDRPEIDEHDVPNLDKIGNLATLRSKDLEEIEARAVEGAANLWRRMMNPQDSLPLGHDGYLKLWALSNPRLTADYIMLDEAQDTNPVVLGVLNQQRSQMVYVGDRHQQIYEWRGAVNAMKLAKAASESHLTTSFRFGERIADAATAVLRRLDEERPPSG
jgi:superfamily I DNA/RNA helicase